MMGRFPRFGQELPLIEDELAEEVSVSEHFETTPEISTAIDTLYETGLFGLDRANVIERLVADRLIQLTREGWLAFPWQDEPRLGAGK
jgi:hypothetical protein